MKGLAAILILFLLCGIYVFPQQKSPTEKLRKDTQHCFVLVKTDPEAAFERVNAIEKEAGKSGLPEIELQAIMVQCIYYRGKSDFEKMMSRAKLLYEKARSYQSNIYELMARRYLFESYIFSGLPEKAVKELEKGAKLIDKLNENDSLQIVARGDFFIAFSNYYSQKGDFQNQLKFLNLAGHEFQKMPNPKYRKELLHIHYSNLATAYNELNQLDSAKYFTKLSESYNVNLNRTDTNINNLWVLANVAMKEENYREALHYLREAEKSEGYKNHLNVENLYDKIIYSYKKLSKKDSARIYEAKIDSLKLSITENQNKSLHKLLKEKDNLNNQYFIYALAVLILILSTVAFIAVRKNRLLAKQEMESQKYLAGFSENHSLEAYNQLLEMLEEANPAYMNYFDEIFPKFASNLLKINPQIIQSEIEFCSLLKLKIPTKDIARYKFITPKTVQNKKYLIRKKLNIPKDVDIYQWFDSI